MKPSLTIIGSGWVGTHILNDYYHMFDNIITTSKSSPAHSRSNGHFFLDIYKKDHLSLPTTDVCLITIPFSRQLKNPDDYFSSISHLVSQLPVYKKILFTSSTSIYKKNNAIVNELSETDTSDRAKALLKTENIIKTTNSINFILRISGICGFDRNSKQKVSKSEIYDSNHPVNLVHIKDISQTFETLLSDRYQTSDIINVTATEHPSKEDYYRFICEKYHLPLPRFISSENNYKKVSNKKLTTSYEVNLKYPSPYGFDEAND